MNRETWWATDHGVTKSWTQLSTQILTKGKLEHIYLLTINYFISTYSFWNGLRYNPEFL